MDLAWPGSTTGEGSVRWDDGRSLGGGRFGLGEDDEVVAAGDARPAPGEDDQAVAVRGDLGSLACQSGR